MNTSTFKRLTAGLSLAGFVLMGAIAKVQGDIILSTEAISQSTALQDLNGTGSFNFQSTFDSKTDPLPRTKFVSSQVNAVQSPNTNPPVSFSGGLQEIAAISAL